MRKKTIKNKLIILVFTLMITFLGFLFPALFIGKEYGFAVSTIIFLIGIHFLYFQFIIEDTITNNLDYRVPGGFSITEKRNRDTFRMLLSETNGDLVIIGTTLDTLADWHSDLKKRLDNNDNIKLLTSDPKGKSVIESSLGKEQAETRIKTLIARLDDLSVHFKQYIENKQMELHIINTVVPIGLVGVNIEKNNGSLLITHNLYKEENDNCPNILLENCKGSHLYDLYVSQWDKLWKESSPYSPSP